MKSHQAIMGIMDYMEIMNINTIQKDIYTRTMIILKKKINLILITLFISGCSIAPGMHLSKNIGQSVYIESLKTEIVIESLENFVNTNIIDSAYKIGKGDQISITVWGLPDIFPLVGTNPDQNLRRVDSQGYIYFPYVGLVKAYEKTQDQLREDIRAKLSSFFNEPQLDVSIARFNSQKVYLLGEVISPKKINLTDIPLTLSDALGEVQGLNNNTSDGGKVFVIRQGQSGEDPTIILADMSSPSSFINSSNFYLKDNDIVYVNAKSTTRWNRVISQFFPFSSFLNSVDNLTSND